MGTLRRVGGAALAALAVAGTFGLLETGPSGTALPTVNLPGLQSAAVTSHPPVFPDGAPTPAVVVVGVPGLRWSDVQGEIPTPGLWLLARDSALGALSVRTVEPTTCPLDGWLTLNSGARSVGPRPDGDCAPVPAPRVDGTAATVPDWAALVAPNDDHSYDPAWGTLA
ncbi:MAG: hypothetical protein H0X00_15415, partial [Sporichthya sp.]